MSVVAPSVLVMGAAVRNEIAHVDEVDVSALDAAATLAAVEDALVVRRRAEARDLALAAHWADLHAADPQLGPGGRREWNGQDRLVDFGGDGTPRVQELCIGCWRPPGGSTPTPPGR